MSRLAANDTFLRQIRAAHSQRMRELEQASERERILVARLKAASVEPDAANAELAAIRHLLRDTVFKNAAVNLEGERLWIGNGAVGSGQRHQAGFGLAAMQACVSAWPDEFAWNADAPQPDVMISVRDWLEPSERWSWDVRRTGQAPPDQPSFW